MTVKRKVAINSRHAENQFSEVFNKCVHYSMAADESTDIISKVQMSVCSDLN
jgi:hypothetical protein